MNFRQLEVFVSIVKFHSFSKAAEELYLTQPTVSAHISALEEEMGVQLIVRSTKAVYPSAAGAVLYEYANNLLMMRDRTYYAMKNYPEMLTSTLEIAASTVPAEYILPKLIHDFSQQYPQVLFSMQETDSGQVIRRVLTDEVMLGFTGTTMDDDKCQFQEIAKDRLVIVTPCTEEYQHYPKDAFPEDALRTAPFLQRMLGSGTRKESDAYLINCGVNPADLHTVAYFDSIESIKRAIEQGMGIAIMSEISVLDMEQQKKVLVFRNENPFMHRRLYCVYRKERQLSPTAELFVKYLKDTCQ